MKRSLLLLTAAAVAVTPVAASAAAPKPTKRVEISTGDPTLGFQVW